MDYRLKNNVKSIHKFIFMFLVFMFLFFLNTTDVFAGIADSGNVGGGGSAADSNTKPNNEMISGLQRASWVPSNIADWHKYTKQTVKPTGYDFDSKTPAEYFVHYSLDGTATPVTDGDEYYGYYDFKVCTSIGGSFDAASQGGRTYLHRYYFKYVEVKTEVRSYHHVGTRTVTGGQNVGLWLYLTSQADKDALRAKEVYNIEYLDVFEMEMKGEETHYQI